MENGFSATVVLYCTVRTSARVVLTPVICRMRMQCSGSHPGFCRSFFGDRFICALFPARFDTVSQKISCIPLFTTSDQL